MRPGHTALALVVAFVWGVNFVAIDVGLRQFPPLLFAALRFFFAAVPGILLFHRPAVRPRWIIAIGMLIGVGLFGLLFVAIHLGMPAGLASLVAQSQVIFTGILAMVVLGERLAPTQTVGMALASGGLFVIAAGTGESVPIGPFLLVVVAAACWAAANVCMRLAQSPPGLGLVVWSSLVPPIPLLALSLVFEGSERVVTGLTTFAVGPLAALGFIVVVATLFGFGSWHALLRRYPAGMVAPYALLVPVAGMSAAWVFLGERPGIHEVAGSIVVLLGLAVFIKGPGWRSRARRLDPLDPAHFRHAGQCEYRETTDPALVRAILRVKDGMGGDYWWVECGACNTCWQVPHYAAENVG